MANSVVERANGARLPLAGQCAAAPFAPADIADRCRAKHPAPRAFPRAFLPCAFLDIANGVASLPANPAGPAGTIHARSAMAKATTIKVKLVSSADTGFYYVTRKNSRTMTEKITKKKYDPVAKKHVEFREAKIK
jgi:large subunit ribosomal protein L33